MKFTRIVCEYEYVLGKNGHRERSVILWLGKSGWTRPTKADGAKDGDTLYEKDTKKAFLFDEETDSWFDV